MKPFISLLLVLATATGATPCRAQEASPRQQDDEVIAVGSSEVLLDAVVRDKRGRPVRDLDASDFEVYEDGVLQRVSSFRLVTRGAPAPGETARGGAKPEATGRAAGRANPENAGATSFGAVAIVFDRLSPDARSRAREAALGYLGAEGRADEFVGVFAIDQSLRVLQAFTNDRRLARQAVEGSASQSSAAFASNAGRVRELSERQANLDRQVTAGESAAAAGGPGGAGGASSLGGDIAEQKMAEMTARTLETFERLERDQQGYATAYGLLAVVNSLRELEGRKALVFFSEGLSIPPAVQSQFRSVVSNANRANVSIYAVDAAGLRAESPNAETRREIESLGARRIRQTSTGLEDTSGQPMSRQLERNEDLLRLNPQSGLGQLAEETGGLLVSGTNDPGARLRQVDEDLHTYYALTYAPSNKEYDGRFRQITVRLKRPGLDVQTRRGYYAVNAAISSPVLSYEAPALALLSGGRRAAEGFPLRAAGFNFPEQGRAGLVSVVVEVPQGVVAFATDAAKKTYQTDFTIVALVKDESQRVVRKLSNQYRLSGPAERLEAARRGQILFYREAELAPGRYTLAVAAYDAHTGRGSTVADVFEVVGPGRGLRLSSLALVKRVERLSEAEQKRPHPFHFGEALVYPAVGEPLRKSVDKQLPFFLTVYTPAGTKAAPKLTVEISQRGRPLGRAALDLPPPDAEGRIKYASSLPLDKLQPGDYELKVTAEDGAFRATRSASFTIQP